MAGLEELRNVLHVIRAWLYPNYLEHGGKFIARAKTEKTLSVEQVCAEAVTRGGSDLNYDTMVDAVNAYFDEAFYQLADGFSVENDYFSIHPKIGGTFDHADAKADKEKNPVDFAFRKRQELRDILSRITVEIEGAAESGAYIAEVLDVASGASDEKLTSGGVVTILGSRIKIAGDAPSCGLYLVSSDGTEQKLTGNFVDNERNRISAQLPALAAGTYRVRVVTQYTSSGFLKEPRQINYEVDLAVNPGQG
ncbi:MAG: DUF4469 domain-containing protein [Treponema sp.]|jgi:hypothetical protein|nr:DUF4469 domain-containing protein [Treponema sp.]